MPRKCICGGRYKSADHTFIVGKDTTGRFDIYDTERIKPGYATFKCNRCGHTASQKLRVAEEKK